MAITAATLRPTSVVTAEGWSASGAASVLAAVSDGLDASFASIVGSPGPTNFYVGFSPEVVGAIYRAKFSLRGKVSTTSGLPSLGGLLVLPGGAVLSCGTVDDTSPQTGESAYTSTAGVGGLSEVRVFGSANSGTPTFTIYDIWLDVEYDDAPVVAGLRAG